MSTTSRKLCRNFARRSPALAEVEARGLRRSGQGRDEASEQPADRQRDEGCGGHPCQGHLSSEKGKGDQQGVDADLGGSHEKRHSRGGGDPLHGEASIDRDHPAGADRQGQAEPHPAGGLRQRRTAPHPVDGCWRQQGVDQGGGYVCEHQGRSTLLCKGDEDLQPPGRCRAGILVSADSRQQGDSGETAETGSHPGLARGVAEVRQMRAPEQEVQQRTCRRGLEDPPTPALQESGGVGERQAGRCRRRGDGDRAKGPPRAVHRTQQEPYSEADREAVEEEEDHSLRLGGSRGYRRYPAAEGVQDQRRQSEKQGRGTCRAGETAGPARCQRRCGEAGEGCPRRGPVGKGDAVRNDVEQRQAADGDDGESVEGGQQRAPPAGELVKQRARRDGDQPGNQEHLRGLVIQIEDLSGIDQRW